MILNISSLIFLSTRGERGDTNCELFIKVHMNHIVDTNFSNKPATRTNLNKILVVVVVGRYIYNSAVEVI